MTAFARVTNDHDAISLTLTPCAGQLYRWLLRRLPAGKSQELYLEEFAEWSSGYRKRPYCIRHLQRALQELLTLGLVDVLKEYTKRIYKLVCHHPDPHREEIKPPDSLPCSSEHLNLWDKNVKDLDEKVTNETKMSTAAESNTDSAVPSYRDLKRTANTPTSLHPVYKTNKERLPSFPISPNVETQRNSEVSQSDFPTSPESQDAAIFSAEKIMAQIEATISPQPMNQNIRKTVLGSPVEVVRDALAVVQQQKRLGRVKRPAGMLVKAIQEKWTPNVLENSGNILPDGFSEWFDLARQGGIVTASMLIDGVMCVCTNPETGDWQPWTELAFAFTTRYLRSISS
jgi:hypothetical protein